MTLPPRDGILLRSLLATMAAFALVAVATLAYTVHSTEQRAWSESNTRLAQLLDTVENTLRVACFVKDQELAREVASGLLSNTEVLAVSIVEGGEVLTAQRRDRSSAALEDVRSNILERDIFSPFKSEEIIGHVRLEPDPAVIAARVKGEAVAAAVRLAWQLALIAVVIVTALLTLVIQPLGTLSESLHRMDPTAGERLPVPAGHANTEFGRLANDVNALAERLVRTLGEEHALRLRREVDEKMYRAIFDNAESAIFMVGREGNFFSWNPAFTRIFNLETREHPNKLADFNWDDSSAITDLIARAFLGGGVVTGIFSLRRADYSSLWFSMSLSPVSEEAAQGVAHDITSLKEAETQARLQAVTDPLTGLANRNGLEAQVKNHIKRDLLDPGGFALLLVDLDDFHQINEGIGIPAGDEVLRAVSERLSTLATRDDTLARISGDIFALVLDALEERTVDNIVCQIPEILRQPYFFEGSPIRLTASTGIALFPHDGVDGPTLLRHAELAVDKAKAAGGNGYVFFDQTLAEAAEQRRHLENDFRLAVRDGHFALFYQPVVDLQAGRLVGAEALIRWRHPSRGIIPPDRFIPMAEQTGLINDLGLWVLESACAQLAAWQAVGTPYHVSINVSGRQIPDGLPPEAIAAALDRHGVSHELLSLEITEGVLLGDIDQAQAWLRAVHAVGISVHLDDFGTGYSSLSYLKRFPLEMLKVDKSFIQDMRHDAGSRSLVEAIIAMARGLGLMVVAEGVESGSDLPLLRAMGCNFVQGFHLARPMPAEDFPIAAERITRLMGQDAEAA